MAKIVCLFNHKGGVSKTTTTFNLGWALAESGKRVLIVDGDPQCNLTGTVLDFEGQNDFETFYKKFPNGNLCAALSPAFEGRPEQLKPATIQATACPGLFILPGHIDLAQYEAQLAVAFSASAALPVLKNLPGAVGHLLRLTAKEQSIDVVLVDMSPSIGALNQSLFLTSDFFVVPTSPDYFCFLAISSLANVLPRWNDSVHHLRAPAPGLSYPLPGNGPKLLGIISQRYRPRSGAPSASFQNWIDRIKESVLTLLGPALEKQNMIVSKEEFNAAQAPDSPYNLANIADFNSLIAQSQVHNTPVFALTDSQLNRVGFILESMKSSREKFREIFAGLATTLSILTGI